MTHDPHRPIEAEGMLDGLQWNCIVRGALLDIVLTAAASFPLLFLLAGPEAFSENGGVGQSQIDQALASPDGMFASALSGFAATAIGAWYGASRAGQHHLRHGGWVAVVSLALALPLSFLPDGQSRETRLWYEVLCIVAMIPAGLLGGFLAQKLQGAARR